MAVAAGKDKIILWSAGLGEATLRITRLSLQQYVPQFPKKPDGEISVRLLAGHLAGICNYSDVTELGNVKS